MDETVEPPIKLILKPHPVSLGLSGLFYLAICLQGSMQYGVPMALAYFMLLNLAIRSKSLTIDFGTEIGDSFLASFANNLASLGPEEAFSKALKRFSSPPLRCALAKVRNGVPIAKALLSIEVPSKSESTLLTAISAALSYGSDEASNRLHRYMLYRQERTRLIAEYKGKMAVLSLRLKVLSAISAASLAVIAFASPLLSFLSSAIEAQTKTINGWPLPAIALFSVSILSPLLYSKTVPDTSSGRITAACAILYLCVFLLLSLTIGWRF